MIQVKKDDLVLDIHVLLLGNSEKPQWKENQEEKEGKVKMNFKETGDRNIDKAFYLPNNIKT